MAIEPKDIYPANVANDPDAYPFGKARNTQGMPNDRTGTPLEERWVNDIWGLQQSLLDAVGATPTGNPDQVGASQYLDALRTLFVAGTVRGYQIASAVNAGGTLDLGPVGTPRAAVMSEDGWRLYVISGTGDSVLQYNLTERWVAKSAVDSGKSKSIAMEDGNPSAVRFRPDGTAMFVNGGVTNTIYQYPLTTPWELDTAGASNGSWSYAGDTTDGTAFDIGNDGTVLLLANQAADNLLQYILSTPWSIGTTGALDDVFGFAANDTPSGVQWRNDGTGFVVALNPSGSNLIRLYDVGTAWDAGSTPSLAEELDVSADFVSSVGDIYMTPAGNTLLAMNSAQTSLQEYITGVFAPAG